MASQPPSARCDRTRPARRAATLGAALAALACALAPAAQARGSAIPNCASLSLSAIATQVGSGALKLERRIGNLCELKGDLGPHHYRPVLDIQLVAGSKALYTGVLNAGRNKAAREHHAFGEVSRRLKVGTAAFFVTSSVSSASLAPCEGGAEPLALGPQCNPQPTLNKYTLVGWGPYRGHGAPVMVSIGYAAQSGDGSLSHLIVLLKELISGKLH